MDNGVSFGSLTTGNRIQKTYQIDYKNLTVEDLDFDADGLISNEEIFKAADAGKIDLLDISSIDKEADKKVTEEQYVLWQQAEDMDLLVETFKAQAAKDLAGESPEDIKKLADKIVEFENEFMNTYMAEYQNDISKMSKEFNDILPKKYIEMKKDTLSNTKSAVKTRVIKNVMDAFLQEDSVKGASLARKVDKSSMQLSDNAQRLLSNILSTEADKFTKTYSGEKYEQDLEAYLTNYLNTSDKDKLAEAIGIWDKDFDLTEDMSTQEAMQKYKNKAKTLFLSALENKIYLKIGDVTVRTEAQIMPALAQYKDAESLRWAINKAINNLSTETKFLEIAAGENEPADNNVAGIAKPVNEPKTSNAEINFFEK